MKKIYFIITIAVFFFSGLYISRVHAAISNSLIFNVNANYDAAGQDQVSATLVKTEQNLYFYIDSAWWALQTPAQQNQIITQLDGLSQEFDNAIYPKLTSTFGSEWRPGIDNDNRLTVLFENMKASNGGYFRQDDEYDRLQVPDSNEREMMYLAISALASPVQLKDVLAHEFMHLIIFNQKNRMQGVQEETWLDELRSDYTSTFLGYDDTYQGSNLQSRVQDFIANPSDSLPEWQNSPQDFAVAHLFAAYLVDHYGVNILADSLHSKLVGIPSLDQALVKNGAAENFSQVFTNWVIALSINDCSANKNYCYLNQNLKNLRVTPVLNFLPLSGSSSLSVTNVTKNWAANWQKIIGGNGNLTLQFSSIAGLNFQLPYLVFDKNGNYSLNFLKLDKNEKGQISIPNFGSDYTSVIVMPLLQSKTTGFVGQELLYQYTLTASVAAQQEGSQTLVQQLLAQIDSLKQQIAALQGTSSNGNLCSSITSNLYRGVKNAAQVQCLQQFLKNQGPSVYPEGLVTGFFGQLTAGAVIRFQNLSGIPATGFVGVLTRTKINALLQ